MHFQNEKRNQKSSVILSIRALEEPTFLLIPAERCGVGGRTRRHILVCVKACLRVQHEGNQINESVLIAAGRIPTSSGAPLWMLLTLQSPYPAHTRLWLLCPAPHTKYFQRSERLGARCLGEGKLSSLLRVSSERLMLAHGPCLVFAQQSPLLAESEHTLEALLLPENTFPFHVQNSN